MLGVQRAAVVTSWLVMGAYRVVVSLILCLGAWGCAAEGAAGGDGGAPVALLEQWTARVSITAHLVDRVSHDALEPSHFFLLLHLLRALPAIRKRRISC